MISPSRTLVLTATLKYRRKLADRLIRVLDENDFDNLEMQTALGWDWEQMEGKVEMLELIAEKLHGWVNSDQV